MRALLSHAPGGPETLRVDEVAEPVAGPGELLVRVRAAAINYPDVLIIEDKYQMRPPRRARATSAPLRGAPGR